MRWKEVAEGKLSLPREPRTLYVLTGTGFDVNSGKVITFADDRRIAAGLAVRLWVEKRVLGSGARALVGRVAAARRGSRRSIRFARLERERTTSASHCRAHRHLPLRWARAFAARSPMSSASWPATEAAHKAHPNTSAVKRWCVLGVVVRASVGRVAAGGSCRSIRFASLTPAHRHIPSRRARTWRHVRR
jgi:hypothetical protein